MSVGLSRGETRAERLKEIEHKLYRASDGIKASELAEEFDVSKRTIYRDLDSLSCMGVPIWDDKGVYYLDRERYVSQVKLNPNEAMALYIAARLLSKHSDKHNPHVVTALHKLAEASPDDVIKAHISKTADLVKGRRPNPEYVEALENITRAWADKRRLIIRYTSSDAEETVRKIDPYFIEPSSIGYSCYVIAYDHLRKAVRTFKIERIKKTTLLDETYEINPDFDPYCNLQTSWGVTWGKEEEVKLKFSPRVYNRVCESEWHSSQVIEDSEDGGCIMTIRAGGIFEMLPWIRSWGGEVEVLSPEYLRRTMVEETEKLMNIYQ